MKNHAHGILDELFELLINLAPDLRDKILPEIARKVGIGQVLIWNIIIRALGKEFFFERENIRHVGIMARELRVPEDKILRVWQRWWIVGLEEKKAFQMRVREHIGYVFTRSGPRGPTWRKWR